MKYYFLRINSKLISYITNLTETTVRQGEIQGLLLTGLSTLAFDLLENYIDRTGDFQTVALIVSMASSKFDSDPRVNHWIET
jgi:hypothetical protein